MLSQLVKFSHGRLHIGMARMRKAAPIAREGMVMDGRPFVLIKPFGKSKGATNATTSFLDKAGPLLNIVVGVNKSPSCDVVAASAEWTKARSSSQSTERLKLDDSRSRCLISRKPQAAAGR